MAVEITAARTLFSKTFDEGNGVRRLRCSTGPMHYRDVDGTFKDIDLDSLDVNFQLTRALYDLDVSPAIIGMRYRSKASGEVITCRLAAVEGTPIGSLPLVVSPARLGRSIVWANCLPGVTLGLRLTPSGVQFVKRLTNALAPRSFTWRVERPSNLTGIRAMPEIHGEDNTLRDPVAGRTVRSFPLELALTQQVLSDDGITQVVLVTETWSGRILKKGVPATDVVYPVEFDPAFQETITANGDDGEEYNDTTWDSTRVSQRTGSYYGTNSECGLRFAVSDAGAGPNSGATISAATLTLTIGAIAGSPDLDIYCEAADNGAAFAAGRRPSTLTKTTAKADWLPVGGGPFAIDVKTPVQEVIDRAGWAPGNALLFLILDQGAGNNYTRVIALENASNGEADLDITYTNPSGGTVIPVFMNQYRQRWA